MHVKGGNSVEEPVPGTVSLSWEVPSWQKSVLRGQCWGGLVCAPEGGSVLEVSICTEGVYAGGICSEGVGW